MALAILRPLNLSGVLKSEIIPPGESSDSECRLSSVLLQVASENPKCILDFVVIGKIDAIEVCIKPDKHLHRANLGRRDIGDDSPN